jgi:outer membrane protein TolC
MRTTKLLGAAALCLPVAVQAQTTNVPERSLSLRECMELAIRHNLSVQIDRIGPEIATFNLESSLGSAYDPVASLTLSERFNSSPGRIDATTALRSPPSENYNDTWTPSLRGTLPSGTTLTLSGNLNRSSGTSFPTGFQYVDGVSLSLAQPLLKNSWIDANRLNIRLNRKNIQSSELTVRATLINTVNSVQQAYYDLIFSVENIKVQEASLALAEKLLAENRKRVEVGALAPLDEKQAESQVAARKADLLTAHRDLDSTQNRLRTLLTDDFASWHGVRIRPTDPLVAVAQTLALQESWQAGMANRPEILQARIDLEKQNIQVSYNYNQLFPSLDLTASYGQNGVGATFGNALNDIQTGKFQSYSYGVVFSVPLSNRDAKNRYSAAKAGAAQSLLRLKKQEQDVVVQIDDAVKSAQTSFDKIDATRLARVYAEIALDAEQKKLESGKSTSFVVLQLQRDLTAARLAEIRAQADYNKALSTLSQTEGTTLEKSGIKVEPK